MKELDGEADWVEDAVSSVRDETQLEVVYVLTTGAGVTITAEEVVMV